VANDVSSGCTRRGKGIAQARPAEADEGGAGFALPVRPCERDLKGPAQDEPRMEAPNQAADGVEALPNDDRLRVRRNGVLEVE
jgi:hypothetical protein